MSSKSQLLRQLSLRKSALRGEDKPKSNGSQPLVVRLFHAIIALKRLVKIRRYFMKGRERGQRSGKSAFLSEIHKSHRSVKYASFGRTVVDVDGDELRQYRAEELDRAAKDQARRQEKLEKMSRRRGGANMKDVNPTNLTGMNLQGAFNASNGFARIDKGSVADRIRALKTSFPSETSRDTNIKKFTVLKETTTKDFTHVLQKNLHITKTQMKKHETNRTNKIRNNLKVMRKMNIQEVLNYATGTAVYFGATLAFQSRHGGYLSYNNFADIKASAPKIVPSARFVVWNCDDPSDHGILRYGDAVWLQAGVHEVLGAQYGGGAISADGTRKLKPSLINCRRENAFKAQQYGRWIVLNRENPSDSLGDQVLHHDKIMLEQEWCYLASHTPYDSFMEKSHSFEDAENKEGADFFKPIDECIWRLHLVTLPSDDNADARFREYLLDQAKEQIKFSAQDRRIKERALSGPLSRRISDSLKPEEVIKRHLPQANSAEAMKLHLLKKFDKQKMKDFSRNGPKASSLKSIYGPQSIVYKNAKAADSAIREKNCKVDMPAAELQRSQEGGTKLTLEETEDLYWDIATNVLADTRAWESLPASMEVYEDLDQSKKEIAVRVLQRMWKKKLSNNFNWKRVMNKIDFKENSKLSNSLLYEASRPVTKPAIFHDCSAPTQDKDSTFLTTAGGKTDNELPLETPSVVKAVKKKERRVSKAFADDEISPMLSRIQEVMHVEVQEVVEDERQATRKHFSDRRHSSTDYLVTGVLGARPHTAPQQDLHQDNEADACVQDLKLLNRHERRNLLSSASTSAVHASNAARMMLRGSSSSNLNVQKERPKSAEIANVFAVEEDETAVPGVTEFDVDMESGVDEGREKDNDFSPKGCADPHTHRILGKFEPKKQTKKQQFNTIIKSLSRTQDPTWGLPQDVFEDPHYDVSVNTSLSFLRASSSTPQIYGDIKTRRRKDIPKTKSRRAKRNK